jgi:hypothetical protein
MRRARARRLAAVAVVSVSQLVCWRSRRQAVTSWGWPCWGGDRGGVLGSGDQGVELALGVAGGLDRGAAGGQLYLERCSVPGGTRLSEVLTTQGFTGGPGRVQRVGLGAVTAGCSLGPVQLHHLLGRGVQEPGQPGAVASGALDRPDPLAWLLGGQGQQLLVAGRRGRHRRLVDHRTGGRGHDGEGVGVLVGVDPDDDIDNLCQRGHCVDS